MTKKTKQITTAKAVLISGIIKCIVLEKSKLPLQRVFGLTPRWPHPSGIPFELYTFPVWIWRFLQTHTI